MLRDADKMLEELGEGGAPKFGGSYVTEQNKSARCLNLPKRETLILPHGQFGRCFSKHSDPLPEVLPFSWETATRFMKIAANPILSDLAHAPNLPASWMTLYELTKLPEDKLEIARSEG